MSVEAIEREKTDDEELAAGGGDDSTTNDPPADPPQEDGGGYDDGGGGEPFAAKELDPDAVRVAQTGKIYMAPVGTAVPSLDAVGSDKAWPAPWLPFGLVNEDGVEHELADDMEPIMSWQGDEVRIIAKKRNISIKFKSLETRRETVESFYGGKFVKEASGTSAKLEISAQPVRPPKAIGWEWTDGETIDGTPATWRMGIDRGQVGEVESPKFSKGNAVEWGFTLKALGGTGKKKAEWVTNDKRIMDGLSFNAAVAESVPPAGDRRKAVVSWSNADPTGVKIKWTSGGTAEGPLPGSSGFKDHTYTSGEDGSVAIEVADAKTPATKKDLTATIPFGSSVKQPSKAPALGAPADNATDVAVDVKVTGTGGVNGASIEVVAEDRESSGAKKVTKTVKPTADAWTTVAMGLEKSKKYTISATQTEKGKKPTKAAKAHKIDTVTT